MSRRTSLGIAGGLAIATVATVPLVGWLNAGPPEPTGGGTTSKSVKVRPIPQRAFPGVTAPKGYRVLWSDDFDHLDPAMWRIYDAANGNQHYGSGNNELQCLTAANVRARGKLVIRGRKEAPSPTQRCGDKRFTSGFLGSRETGTYYPLFGRFEIRARVPHGQGVWPAFWLRHRNGSSTAEVDVLELFHNQVPGKVTSTLHFPETLGTNTYKVSSDLEAPSQLGGWHRFAVTIRPAGPRNADGGFDAVKFVFSIDGRTTGRYVNTQAAGWTKTPAATWDVALNLALGGNWVGHPEQPDSRTSGARSQALGYLPKPNVCGLTYRRPPSGDPYRCPTTGLRYSRMPVKYKIDYLRVFVPKN